MQLIFIDEGGFACNSVWLFIFHIMFYNGLETTTVRKRHHLIWQRFTQLFLSELDILGDDVLWTHKDTVRAALTRVSVDIEQDSKTITQELDFISLQVLSTDEHTKRTLDFIENYLCAKSKSVSMPALCLAAFEILGGFDGRDDLMFPVLAAASLGEVPHDLPYHNNDHYKKVLLHTLRLIAIHNAMYDETRNVFTPEEIAQLLAGACAHDIGHEAKGNFVERKYMFAAQEQKSYTYIHPLLLRMGFNETMCEHIRIMFLTTDVTPFGDPISPSNQLRLAYEMHFGTSDYDDNASLAAPLKMLEEDGRLALMCMILHEADIMNSAGLNYNVTIGESIRISQEIGKTSASPEDTYMFLKMICQERMNSDAAQFLAAENLRKISDHVNEDLKNGVHSYDMKRG